MNDGHRPAPRAATAIPSLPGLHVHVCAGVTLPEQHTNTSCVCVCGARFDPAADSRATLQATAQSA